MRSGSVLRSTWNRELERKAVRAWYERGNSLLSRVRAFQAEGRHQIALAIAERTFRDLPEPLRLTTLRDIVLSTVMDRPGNEVRAWRRCPLCGGRGAVYVHPEIARIAYRIPPGEEDKFQEDCPQCGGEGLLPEEPFAQELGSGLDEEVEDQGFLLREVEDLTERLHLLLHAEAPWRSALAAVLVAAYTKDPEYAVGLLEGLYSREEADGVYEVLEEAADIFWD